MRGEPGEGRGSAEASGAFSAQSKGSQLHRPGGSHVSHRNGNNAVPRPHLGDVSHRKGNNAVPRPPPGDVSTAKATTRCYGLHLDDLSHRNGKDAADPSSPYQASSRWAARAVIFASRRSSAALDAPDCWAFRGRSQLGLGHPGPRRPHGPAARAGTATPRSRTPGSVADQQARTPARKPDDGQGEDASHPFGNPSAPIVSPAGCGRLAACRRRQIGEADQGRIRRAPCSTPGGKGAGNVRQDSRLGHESVRRRTARLPDRVRGPQAHAREGGRPLGAQGGVRAVRRAGRGRARQ